MTSLFPHTAYEEDQPNAHAILYLHTIRAGTMVGSFLSLLTAPTSLAISRYRHSTPFNASTFIPRLLRHSGRGLIIGGLFGAVATFGRMMGKEEIEWQDRAWRLQGNKSQTGTDVVSLDAAVVGGLVGILAARRGAVPMGMGQAAIGGTGLGMATGVGYMVSAFEKPKKPAI